MAVEATAPPATRRFTADEVWRMAEAGIIRPEERVELIDGELLVLSPGGYEHQVVLTDLTGALHELYGSGWMLISQSSRVTAWNQLPEPDLTVVHRDGTWNHERRVARCDESVLIVEVSVTTRTTDRRKARIYAAAGAPEYWLIDVPKRTVTIHRGSHSDGTWSAVTTLGEDADLTPPQSDGTLRLRQVLPGPAPG